LEDGRRKKSVGHCEVWDGGLSRRESEKFRFQQLYIFVYTQSKYSTPPSKTKMKNKLWKREET
jgi:hypothetical protein